MASASRAWVFNVCDGQHVAAGARHVVEYLVAPETTAVPLAPVHVAGLLYWRERYIPVVDLAPLFGAQVDESRRRAVVIAYQNAPGEPLQHGALLVGAAPMEVQVDDGMASELPATPLSLRHVARACFRLDDRIVPILDMRRLFAQSLPAMYISADSGCTETATRVVDDRLARPASIDEASVLPKSEGLPAEVWIMPEASATGGGAMLGSQVKTTEPPTRESDEKSYGVVIPFASSSPLTSAEIGSEYSVLMNYSSSTVESAEMATIAATPDTAGRQSESAAENPRGPIRPASSAALRSLRRLQEIERRHVQRTTSRRATYRWSLVAIALISLLALAWILLHGVHGSSASTMNSVSGGVTLSASNEESTAPV